MLGIVSENLAAYLNRLEREAGHADFDYAKLGDKDGTDRIYMNRETKNTLDESKRRENAKIKAAREHLKQLGIGSETIPAHAVSAHGNWSL